MPLGLRAPRRADAEYRARDHRDDTDGGSAAHACSCWSSWPRIGLHLSIDDFGTGYSSLSALQQFPIGTLKIDQSFVRDLSDDPGDATLVRTIIDMGHGLGMQVVAEGVESPYQLEFLRANGCDEGQGRLFGEPVQIESLLEQLRVQQSGRPAFADLIAATGARSASA